MVTFITDSSVYEIVNKNAKYPSQDSRVLIFTLLVFPTTLQMYQIFIYFTTLFFYKKLRWWHDDQNCVNLLPIDLQINGLDVSSDVARKL